MNFPDTTTGATRNGDVAATIARFVDAVNRGDLSAAVAHFTADATIVEDIAPYRWQGPEAGSQWLAAMGGSAARMGLTEVVMELGDAVRIEVEERFAYALFAGVLHLGGLQLRLKVDGQLTFSLETEGERWLINAMTWSGPAPAP